MNMEEATIACWHKQPGEDFEAGEPLYEIETDKVTQSVQAQFAGTLLKHLIPAGDTALVGQAVCIVEARG
jgi:pyruvate dehydrogenase E2 component (dihydrolipoamide acetyltransferase)